MVQDAWQADSTARRGTSTPPHHTEHNMKSKLLQQLLAHTPEKAADGSAHTASPSGGQRSAESAAHGRAKYDSPLLFCLPFFSCFLLRRLSGADHDGLHHSLVHPRCLCRTTNICIVTRMGNLLVCTHLTAHCCHQCAHCTLTQATTKSTTRRPTWLQCWTADRCCTTLSVVGGADAATRFVSGARAEQHPSCSIHKLTQRSLRAGRAQARRRRGGRSPQCDRGRQTPGARRGSPP